MRVARLIIYDTDDKARMKRQLSKSLPENIHKYGNMKITVLNVADVPILAEAVKKLNI